MGVVQYIGARYVPLFTGQWDNTKAYEPLCIVTHNGASYTSRQAVPVGIDISNSAYWALSGNYDAQVQSYIQTVKTFDGRIDALEDRFPVAGDDIADAAITTAKIADDAVTTDKIADDAVTTDKITDNAVTTAKITDDAIVTAKIADDAVTTDKIADDAVTPAKIADDAITTPAIENGAVTKQKLASFYGDDIDNLQDQIDTIRSKDLGVRKYFYCDSVNGSDDNTGGTAATAFKTFERALKAVEEGYTDINIRFLPGEYYNYDWRWTNLSLHLIGYSGAIIHMSPEEKLNIYNCYVHCEKSSGDSNPGQPVFLFENGIHSDASSLWFNNVTLRGETTDAGGVYALDFYMGHSEMINCTFDHIKWLLRGGVYHISGGEVINNNTVSTRLTAQSSHIVINELKDTSSTLPEEATDSYYLDLQYCTAALYLTNMTMQGANKYTDFMRCRYCEVQMLNSSYVNCVQANSTSSSGITGVASYIRAKTTNEIVTS